MTIKVPGEGFFTTSGVLREAARSAGDSAQDPVARETAAAMAAAITDAAVIKVSSQMNLAGTGFDAGVEELVQEAVLRGLQQLSGRVSVPASGAPGGTPGGSYQNELMAGSAPPPNEKEPVEVDPKEKKDNGKSDEAPGKTQAHSGGRYQNEIIKAAKDSQSEHTSA